MLQNIKVDVIYYYTATDFEMEFNLCGCCRMRLLTDKATERKAFIQMLSRAVSRSRVIVCCGPLFGDTGLINGVATAISKSVVTVNNDDYGIKDSGEIGIIEGSMPLVTSDGIFGGCIIESGPQAIILLSESKPIRKNIMNTLIHPYIEELSVTPIKTDTDESKKSAEEPTEEIIEESAIQETVMPTVPTELPETEIAPLIPEPEMPDVISEDIPPETSSNEEPSETIEETIAAETVQEIEEIPENEEVPAESEMLLDTILSETDTPDDQKTEDIIKPDENGEIVIAPNITEPEPDDFDDDINDGLYIEAQQVKFTKKHYYDVDYEAGADSYQYYAESDNAEPRPTFRTPILIFTVILLLSLLMLSYLLIFIPIRDGFTFTEYIKHIFSVASVGLKLR